MKHKILTAIIAVILATPASGGHEDERQVLISFLENNQCSGSKPELRRAFKNAELDRDLAVPAILRLVSSGEAAIMESGRMVLLQVGEVCGKFANVAEPFDPNVVAALVTAYEKNSCVIDLASPQFAKVIDKYSEDAFQNAMAHLVSTGQIKLSGHRANTSTYIGSSICEK